MADPIKPIFGIKIILRARVMVAPKIDKYAPKIVLSINLYHIDSYRLNSSKDFLKIGGEEFLNQKTGVTLIEWADLIRDILPQNTIVINFSRLNHENSRQIEIQDY